MNNFEYSVTTKAKPRAAWDIFSNWRRWHTFANIYGSLRWWRGEPWQVGSRMQIEILQPVVAMVDHVITSCEPGRKVSWLDHALGVTLEQWVLFHELPKGKGTEIETRGEFVGPALDIAGRTVGQVLTEFTHTWYGNFRAVCDQLAVE